MMLVRYLCVLRVRFWCLELCVFLYNCLLYAPWAQLRTGAQRPHKQRHIKWIIKSSIFRLKVFLSRLSCAIYHICMRETDRQTGDREKKDGDR